jgi:xanthine dehydrogenase accessory factor
MKIDLFKKALSALKEGQGGIIVTITESPNSSLTGMKLWWEEPEAGSDGFVLGYSPQLKPWKEQLQELCWEAWKEKYPKLKIIKLEEGKHLELFAQPVLSAPSLVIFGAGHVATELASIVLNIGDCHVIVIDDRPEFASASRFPGAKVLCCDFTEAFQKIAFHANIFIVIITRGHKHDAFCLEKALQTPAGYIGMIGSPQKVKLTKERLFKLGYSPEDWKRVYAPVGLPIGAQTPSEIAISILAEIIAVKHGVR